MSKGFSLIEILIAISVMIIGIVGIYNIAPRTISWTATNIDRFIVSQLAREGLELVRNIRDTNWLKGENWNKDLAPNDYEIAYNSGLSSFQDRFLKIDGDGFYNYQNGASTEFKRKITIASTTDPEGIKIKSMISWSNNKSFTIEENLYNWR